MGADVLKGEMSGDRYPKGTNVQGAHVLRGDVLRGHKPGGRCPKGEQIRGQMSGRLMSGGGGRCPDPNRGLPPRT